MVTLFAPHFCPRKLALVLAIYLFIGITAARNFLLYDVDHWERFNSRKTMLRRVLPLAHDLQHNDPSANWTLVLPPFHFSGARARHIDAAISGTEGDSKYTWRSWHNYFDIARLRAAAGVNVIDFSDWWRIQQSRNSVAEPRIDATLLIWSARMDNHSCTENSTVPANAHSHTLAQAAAPDHTDVRAPSCNGNACARTDCMEGLLSGGAALASSRYSSVLRGAKSLSITLFGRRVGIAAGSVSCAHSSAAACDTANRAKTDTRNEPAGAILRADSTRLRKLLQCSQWRATSGSGSHTDVNSDSTFSVLLEGVQHIRYPLPRRTVHNAPVKRHDAKADAGAQLSRFWPFRVVVQSVPKLKLLAHAALQQSLHTMSSGRRSLPPTIVALHWRRGDFNELHSHSAASASQAAQAVFRVLQERVAMKVAADPVPQQSETPIVYVASNANTTERCALLATLCSGRPNRPAVLGSIFRCGVQSGNGILGTNACHCYMRDGCGNNEMLRSTMDEGDEIIVEQLVCATADIFIGSTRSGFSREIHLERLIASNNGTAPSRTTIEAAASSSFALASGGRLLPLCVDEADRRPCEQWFDTEAAILWARRWQMRQERKMQRSTHLHPMS